MIMRQINAAALAEAKTLHLEQTCDLLQACHLAENAQPVNPNPSHPTQPGAPHQPNARSRHQLLYTMPVHAQIHLR